MRHPWHIITPLYVNMTYCTNVITRYRAVIVCIDSEFRVAVVQANTSPGCCNIIDFSGTRSLIAIRITSEIKVVVRLSLTKSIRIFQKTSHFRNVFFRAFSRNTRVLSLEHACFALHCIRDRVCGNGMQMHASESARASELYKFVHLSSSSACRVPAHCDTSIPGFLRRMPRHIRG